MPKIYTKTGDDGTSGLVSGERIKKYDLRLEAYGTVDELNSFIALLAAGVRDRETTSFLTTVQHRLFNIGSILALGDVVIENYPTIELDHINTLETEIDLIQEKLSPLSRFILPPADEIVARAHICRTVCRRAERRVVALEIDNEQVTNVVMYLNRLSDYFFVLSRSLSLSRQIPELYWAKDA